MSKQSTLGEGAVAEDLAEGQREISIAEFFEKNKHMLGFDSGARALVTVVKEAVDNALDACQEAAILPDVYVEISDRGDYYRVVVEDNGPGITREEIPKVFGKLLYGSRFHAREQSRGQQGIGISAAVLYAQLTSGKPARITSRTGNGSATYFEVTIDTDTNEPSIDNEESTTWDRPHGTRIELDLEANMRARSQLHDYITHTAVVNPHARIELREPNAHLTSERATDQLPAETSEIRPHPHGVQLGTLIKMLEDTDSYSLSGFLQEEFTRVGRKTADNVTDAFRDRWDGRELAWAPPGAHETDLAAAIRGAVANKGREATRAFAERVVDALGNRERVAHHEVGAIVDEASDAVEGDYEVTFGVTVREKARRATWTAICGGETDDAMRDRLRGDCFTLLDDATSSRKDEATIEGWASRLAGRIARRDDDRCRLTRDKLRDLIDAAADGTEEYDDATIGETARENALDAFWTAARTVPDDPPTVDELAADRDAAAALLEGMRETDIIAPPTDCLSPITADLIEAGLRKEVDAEFYAASTRDAAVHGGDPFVVEAGIAYGGELADEGEIDLMRYANRVPLVYQRGACATTDVVRSINWRNYELDQPGGSGMPQGPAVVLVHVASTNVPFTSESKDAIANLPEIEDEIELAVREAARELKSFLKERRSRAQRREKRDQLATILPAMATKLEHLTERPELAIEDTLARIMNNVLVDRDRDGSTVTLTVENNGTSIADLEVTEMVAPDGDSVAVEIGDTETDDARTVDLDGEVHIKWSPSVAAGETETLEYDIDGPATISGAVDGIADERLTLDD
ncbi:DNA topoisomerase VI subunit B [Halococcoides cellulosivorans]|uniref:Type 2 DNA topoisomerase 6 subunit B n=1 Tax=Halococcoides cellulosivorans TaxID=1679096 RepID=A0A2R4WYT9_9EURY|nr:DNA topoisomerase VI subunit B [Halococcoides cellulosivorans]AWB26702.1 DNA topoisomerase VI subunit B [Halococcoides cellulosivorans]